MREDRGKNDHRKQNLTEKTVFKGGPWEKLSQKKVLNGVQGKRI